MTDLTERLTRTEITYLQDIADGLSDEQIAEKHVIATQSAKARYSSLSLMFKPQHVYRWSREQFREYIRTHVLCQEGEQ